MQTSTIKLYSLNYNDSKSYIAAALFVLGNIALPQICHLVPQGGMIFLILVSVCAYFYGTAVITIVVAVAVSVCALSYTASAVTYVVFVIILMTEGSARFKSRSSLHTARTRIIVYCR